MKKHIIDLISGIQARDASLFDEFVGRSTLNPYTLWYLSAGLDFRDVLECSTERRLCHDFPEPGIYVHSDQTLPYVIAESSDILYCDGRSTVVVMAKSAVVTIGAYPAVLMLLQIESDLYGQIIVPVIYIVANNLDLFSDILVANNVAISHFVKVREGCGGYPERSINNEIDRLPLLGVRYALLDHQTKTEALAAYQTGVTMYWSYGQAGFSSSAMVVKPYRVLARADIHQSAAT